MSQKVAYDLELCFFKNIFFFSGVRILSAIFFQNFYNVGGVDMLVLF